MRVTNKFGLPESIVKAVENDPYKGGGDISVTTLIAPPQMRLLSNHYRDELEEDASDRIWSLIGQAVHSILERIDDGSIKEQRLYMDVEGWSVSGQFDRYLNKSLIDYKITSVWSVKQGVKREWEEQLNLLAVLCRANGYPVERLGVTAILRDWRKNEAYQYSDYPQSQVQTIPIPLWEIGNAMEFMVERVNLHQRVTSGEHIPCTNEERWYRGEKWAVMKKGRKSALRLLDTEVEAKEWIEKNDAKGEIVHRPGNYIRCEQYCSVSKFCKQHGGHNAKETNRQDVP